MEREMTMVERVARAICRVDLIAIAMEENISLSPNGLDASLDKEWRKAIPNARAAIEAIREPTQTMVKHGEDAIELSDGAGVTYEFLSRDEIGEIWQSMIDAALKEHDGA